jgi:uncharacterized RDD family membrane protein YckC
VLDALEHEILSRTPTRVMEIEDCYYLLNKEQQPEHARRLLRQIEACGGFSLGQPLEITPENRYKTFWRRFWALFLDGFVIGIPLALILYLVRTVEIFGPAIDTYVDQAGRFASIVYVVAMHAIYGQTLGKMATGVKVMDKTESRIISLRQSLIRESVPTILACASLVYLLGFGPTGDDGELTKTGALILLSTGIAALAWWVLEIVTMLFNRQRRAVHDLIAGSVVIRTP